MSIAVTCNFFTVYNTVPIAGRAFREDECATPGASPVVVIGEDLWRSRSDARSTIVGTTIDLNDRPFTVVGVMPAGYDGQLRGPISLRQEMADRFMRIVGVVVFLGVVAIGLAMIGLYGVTAFAASRRTKEVGIRTALGATRYDIVRLVLASGVKPILLGLVVGITLAAPASRALQQVLVRVPIDTHDPLVFGATAVLLTVVAFAAMFGPARRAAAADPIHALRPD